MLPAPLMALMHDRELNPGDFSHVRLCISGGDKVPLQLQRDFEASLGFAIDECFGMSECGVATVSPPSGENRIGSVGRVCAGFECSIRDEQGEELPVGAVGRLWLRSETVMTGYWDNPSATAEAIVEGWLDTGDEMRADADGYLWFCGRRKQIIVHDGSNICPQDVEEALCEHPAVELAGAIGIHDVMHGENVRAYITLQEGAAAPPQRDLIRFARERIGYKAPEEIVVLRECPSTPVARSTALRSSKWRRQPDGSPSGVVRCRDRIRPRLRRNVPSRPAAIPPHAAHPGQRPAAGRLRCRSWSGCGAGWDTAHHADGLSSVGGSHERSHRSRAPSRTAVVAAGSDGRSGGKGHRYPTSRKAVRHRRSFSAPRRSDSSRSGASISGWSWRSATTLLGKDPGSGHEVAAGGER